MKVNLYKQGQVEVCTNNTCIKATGNLAEIITAALVVAILMIGIAAIVKATN